MAAGACQTFCLWSCALCQTFCTRRLLAGAVRRGIPGQRRCRLVQTPARFSWQARFSEAQLAQPVCAACLDSEDACRGAILSATRHPTAAVIAAGACPASQHCRPAWRLQDSALKHSMQQIRQHSIWASGGKSWSRLQMQRLLCRAPGCLSTPACWPWQALCCAAHLQKWMALMSRHALRVATSASMLRQGSGRSGCCSLSRVV